MKTRILATIAVATVLSIGASAPAFASQAYTGAVSSNAVAPGGYIQYSSDNTGEPDGTPGSYSLSGGQSGALGGTTIQLAANVTHAVQVGAHGHLAFKVRIPATAKPGSKYTLSVKAGRFTDKQVIKIVGVAASAAAAANLTPVWIVLALAILIVLAFIFIVGRRRRKVTQ